MQADPSNTYIFDPESPTEMARLINQDRIVTGVMGGPLSGIADSSGLRNILDLGCGPGSWVLDAAFALPNAEVEGVDISRTMIDYANARARSQRLFNASFGVMDITHPLDFPDACFDLVNERFLHTALKQEAWTPLLTECTRVLRPGGFIRFTEWVDFGTTSSAAFNQLATLSIQAIWKVGHGFSPDGRFVGLTHILPSFLRQLGYQDVRLIGYGLEFSAGMPAWTDQYHNLEVGGYQLKPLLVKTGLLTPEAFDRLHQQALIEIQQPEFCGVFHFSTMLGQKAPLS